MKEVTATLESASEQSETKKMPLILSLLGLIFKTKTGKAVGGGGALAAAVFALHSDMTVKIQEAQAAAVKHSDNSYQLVAKDIGYIKETLGDTKRMLEIMDRRLYDMSRRKEKGDN